MEGLMARTELVTGAGFIGAAVALAGKFDRVVLDS